MRRGPLITAAAVVVLGALLSVVTNWGTEVVPAPAWLKSPLVLGLVVVVLVLLLVLGAFLSQRQPAAPPAEPTFAAVAPSLRPPPPGPVFGRDDELAELAASHREPVLDVVCAGGGTGKTTLARERARRHGAPAFWIDWRNDPDVLATSMVEVARTLGLAADTVAQAQRTGASLADLVWVHLESVRGWLVVVDNVDDVDPLQSGATRIATYRGWLRPTASGQLLVTTRIQDAELWGPQARLHRIGRLSTAAGAAVLRNHAPHGGDAAEELAERLGGHSLALRAAGRAVGARTSAWPTFTAYLDALREQRISVLPDAPDATDPETARRLVGHTWEVSLDQLVAKPETRLARPLLRALSLLARAPVPRGLITSALLPEPATEAAVDAALAGLDRYGLLEPAAPGTVLLHPLVRETSAALLARDAEVAPWRERVEDRVVAFVEETAAREREGWDDARSVAPHVLELSGLVEDADEGRFVRARDAGDVLAEQLRNAGVYGLEVEVRQQVLSAEIRCRGPASRDVLSSRMALGIALVWHGEARAAEASLRGALALAEEHHHGDVLRARHNLAVALMEVDQVDEAIAHLTAVRDAVAPVGEAGDWSDRVAYDLTIAFTRRGDHDDAAALCRQIVARRERALGVDHPLTLDSIDQLAINLTALGRYREAMELDTRALAQREQLLGADHPGTLTSGHNLAVDHRDLGDHRSALELARRVLDRRERVLGAEHLETLRTRELVEECEAAVAASTPLRRLRARLRR